MLIWAFITQAFGFIVQNIKYILIGIACLFVVAFFWERRALKNVQAELSQSQAQVVQLKKDVAAIVVAHDKLAAQAAELNQKTVDLTNKLKKHELSKLAATKPKLVEKAINDGTAKALKCLELSSSGGKC